MAEGRRRWKGKFGARPACCRESHALFSFLKDFYFLTCFKPVLEPISVLWIRRLTYCFYWAFLCLFLGMNLLDGERFRLLGERFRLKREKFRLCEGGEIPAVIPCFFYVTHSI